MINAELSYNPYLMETKIKFNGQPPRINSLVEKYQEMNLQSWINKIPRIFYDEMNGYYFELDFTGTQLDYEMPCKTFRKAGISDKVVPIVHKGCLEDRITKHKRMDDLLTWLQEKPNHRFDYDAFRAENSEFFDSGYSYIYLHGRSLEEAKLEDIDLSVEYVDTVEELNNTDLSNIPILIYITENTLPMLSSELDYFKNRDSVTENQLFFMIGGMLDQKTTERIIRDLGVVNPKIVDSPADEVIRKYIEIYPVTDYVRSALIKLREEAVSISVDLDIDNKQNAITNREVQEKIDSINAMLERLKTAFHYLQEYPDSLSTKYTDELRTELLNKVRGWRKNRTKINKSDEASVAAVEFEKTVIKWFSSFAEDVKRETIAKAEGIRNDFDAEYAKTQYDDYRADTPEVVFPDMDRIEPFAPALLEMKEVQYVEAKEDLFGMLFKQRQSEEKEMVLETTYEYNAWREYVFKLVNEAAVEYVIKLCKIYNEYAGDLKEKYQNYIDKAITQELSKKLDTESHMSEDAKKLQSDNEWLSTLNDKRLEIEGR